MKSEKAIRLNITIHPEKDPALFDFISAISNKEARARRLINLACIGLFIEKFNSVPQLTNLNSNSALNLNEPPANDSSKENNPKKVVFAEGELDSLGSMFE